MVLKGLRKKISNLPKAVKVAGAVAGAGAIGIGAVALGKKLFHKRKKYNTGATLTKLKNRVLKARLKRQLIMEQRKLFKEQLKGV